MQAIINQLATIKEALGTLQITTTRHNLDCILGSMQIIDKVIEQLSATEGGQNNDNPENLSVS